MIRNLLYHIGLLLIIPFFLPLFSFCQEGNLYITNFQMDGSYGSQNWAITQDNMNVMLFANRKGIMTFDSEEWEIIKTPDIPYSIAKEPNTGQIFVGCNEDFGYIAMNDTGNYHYFSLSENFENIGEITSIEITDNHLYYYSNQSVIRFSINNLFDFKQWISEPERPFNGIVKLNNTVYVNIESVGLHEIVGITY